MAKPKASMPLAEESAGTPALRNNIDVTKIVADMRKLYAKDHKVESIINTADVVKANYTDADVIPLPPENLVRQLFALPGLPYNKMLQIFGRPDCGKSTAAGEVMAAAQKSGVQVVMFESEGKWDKQRYESQFGGAASRILLAQTNEILKGGELCRKYINMIKEQDSDAKILFVWDSIGGSQSRSHAERELDSEKHAQPGQDAKENGSVMKMLVALINKYPDSIAVLLINQCYTKMGFMQKGDAASGGTKIEFHSSGIVTLRRVKVLTKTVKGVLQKYGIITRATVTKNHLSQGLTSVHQMDFQVTAEGAKALVDKVSDAEETDDGE